MEYALLAGSAAQSLGAKVKMTLQMAYDKMFENPLLLAIVVGSVILLGLWALRTSR